jgi:cell division protein FtsB
VARPEPEGTAPRAEEPRSRFTGRAAVLVLVLAVLTVSYASSLRAFLEQRSHINDLKSQIAEHEANIDELESEKDRWEDPAYVEKQARERLGYVMPGEKTYLVLGEDGKPLEPASELQDPSTVLTTTQTPWWSDGWASVELAGNPPKVDRPPATEIDGTRKGTGGEGSAGETPEAP